MIIGEIRAMKASYVPARDTAKLVRAALRAAFPSIGVSVRAHVYRGGSSLDVAWTEGPSTKAVEAVAGRFAGARLDGGLELRVRVLHWLLPDGTAMVASNEGTQDRQGAIPPEREWMPHPEARLVHFAPDFVFCNGRVAVPAEDTPAGDMLDGTALAA